MLHFIYPFPCRIGKRLPCFLFHTVTFLALGILTVLSSPALDTSKWKNNNVIPIVVVVVVVVVVVLLVLLF